jgi:hypothetical protein
MLSDSVLRVVGDKNSLKKVLFNISLSPQDNVLSRLDKENHPL